MQGACDALDELGVPYETRVVSAHRTPRKMVDYAASARGRGLKVIVAGAGGAAHLPGMLASLTTLPVVGVPVVATPLGGVDALHSIVQMPAGVPVATVGVGNSRNGGLLAARILAVHDADLAARLDRMVEERAERVEADDERARRG